MYQNRISIIGFVGNDAQLKTTKNGTPVAILSVATKASWKNSKGGYDSRTEWHRCTVWGKLADLPARWKKAHTFRSRANCAIASTRKIAGAMRTLRQSSAAWPRFTPTAS